MARVHAGAAGPPRGTRRALRTLEVPAHSPGPGQPDAARALGRSRRQGVQHLRGLARDGEPRLRQARPAAGEPQERLRLPDPERPRPQGQAGAAGNRGQCQRGARRACARHRGGAHYAACRGGKSQTHPQPAKNMKAAFFRRYGSPEVLEYGDLPDPVPGAGEVLVDIHAASVNAADWKMRAGQYGAKLGFPHIPGRDFSGVVAAVGKGANDFKPGDAVFGVCEVPRESAYAEKIAIRQEIVARKPERLTHVQCAAVGLAGLTALISIEDTLKLRSGGTILIQGGAGGVAGIAIALARHIGARVITTASAANRDYVRALGAD